MKIKIKISLLVATVAFIFSCEEQGRFMISEGSTVPPDVPVVTGYRPLPGAVTLFYEAPRNEDLLTIDAQYIAANGELVWFSASYFVDSLTVRGFAEEIEYTIEIFATNRAGIRSQMVPITVTPLESALPQVAANIQVKPATRSFLLDWENELMQTLNIFVDFNFTENGVQQSFTRVFSSNREIERQFILDMDIQESTPINVSVWVEDLFGNSTEVIDKGQIFVMQDEDLDHTKPDWFLPLPGFQMGNYGNDPYLPMATREVTQVDGNNHEGRLRLIHDNIRDHANLINFMHAGSISTPWDILIDLGAYYELTRIATWQRRFHGPPGAGDPGHHDLGALYDNSENIGRYAMWRWDEETNEWEYLSEHTIPNLRALGFGTLEIVMRHAREGDEAYVLPDPGYTKPTRWFRYQALAGFGSNYQASSSISCLSEISLFGRFHSAIPEGSENTHDDDDE